MAAIRAAKSLLALASGSVVLMHANQLGWRHETRRLRDLQCRMAQVASHREIQKGLAGEDLHNAQKLMLGFQRLSLWNGWTSHRAARQALFAMLAVNAHCAANNAVVMLDEDQKRHLFLSEEYRSLLRNDVLR